MSVRREPRRRLSTVGGSPWAVMLRHGLIAGAAACLALVVAAALLLRWLPHHGLAPVLPLVAAAVLALGIWLRQGLRYRRGARSVALESSAPDPLEILAISAAVVVLGALSLLTILLA